MCVIATPFLVRYMHAGVQFLGASKITLRCQNLISINHFIQQLLVPVARQLRFRFVPMKCTLVPSLVLPLTGNTKKVENLVLIPLRCSGSSNCTIGRKRLKILQNF